MGKGLYLWACHYRTLTIKFTFALGDFVFFCRWIVNDFPQAGVEGAMIRFLMMGIGFGIILTKSEAASWFRIQNMFLFKEAHMYLLMASAVTVGALGIFILKKTQLKSVSGQPIHFGKKALHKGLVPGGVMFGAGWALTGARPGPIFVQMGTGAFAAIITFLGALFGVWIYGFFASTLESK